MINAALGLVYAYDGRDALLHEGRLALLALLVTGLASRLTPGGASRRGVLLAAVVAIPAVDVFRRLVAVDWVVQPALLRFDALQLPTMVPEGFRPASPGQSWGAYASVVWALGALFLLSRLVIGMIRWRRIVAGAAVCRRGQQIVGQLVGQPEITRPVTVLQSKTVPTPMTGGVRRPVIVLPTSLLVESEDRVRAVLLHELGHVARLDMRAILAAHVVSALHWWNPFVWWLRRRLLIAMELAADAFALRHRASATDLAEALLDVARNARTFPDSRPALSVGSVSHLRRRVAWLLTSHKKTTARTPRWLLGCTAAISMAVACIAAPDREPMSRSLAGGFDFGGNTDSDSLDEQGRITRDSRDTPTAPTATCRDTSAETPGELPGTDRVAGVGGLAARDVVQGVEESARSLWPCIEQARAEGVLAPGEYRLLLSWNILPDGSVDEARMDGPAQIRTDPLSGCISAAMRSWRFPASERGAPVRNFPLPFSIR